MTPMTTPASLGYRFPAEWEPHAATWIAWPHNRDTWPGKFEPVPALFGRLVELLTQFEPVEILAGGPSVMQDALQRVGKLPRVTLHDIPTNDAWIRDYGPTFLVSHSPNIHPALIDWQFNCWGAKYASYALDNRAPELIAETLAARRFEVPHVMEGGGMDHNGAGTFLVTKSCLLDRRRNPNMTIEQAESLLRDYCGAKKIIWIEGQLAGDDTDGHIDQLARFVNRNTIVVAHETDSRDENFGPLQQLRQQLERATDQGGEPLQIVPLPMPRRVEFAGMRLPASYANFYLVNGGAIVPQFNDPADREALAVLSAWLPGRQICPWPSTDIVLGLGGCHCLTQQQPV